MADNPYVNRVETADGEALMDISDTDATTDSVVQGRVFYASNGQRSIGTLGDFNGATSSTAGTSGLVPAPSAGDDTFFLRGDGEWAEGGRPMVILSYGNSTWAQFIAAYNAKVIVYCRASSNSNPATGSQTRMAFMAYVNNAENPTEVEFQYYRSVSSHSATQQGDQVYVYKLTSAGAWTVTVRESYTKIVAGTNMTSSYSSGTLTLNATVPDISGKVDKETGKRLSTNDYDDTEKAKVAGAIQTSEKGANNGVAELDSTGKIPSSQLPSYVDDVHEYASISALPATGETGKIYVALDTNKTYRWGGSEYVEISASIALGETGSTAYRGDRGKAAYDHATDSGRLTTAKTSGLYKIGVTAEGHVASATPVTKGDITDLGVPGSMPDITGKLDIDQGSENYRKVMMVDSSGEIVPDDLPEMTGTDGQNDGVSGAVPTPYAGDEDKFLKGDGTWSDPPGGTVTGALLNEDNISPDSDGILDLGYVIRPNYDDQKGFESVTFQFETAPAMFSAYNVWTNGNDVFYGDTSSQYILNKTTHTWEDKTFNIQIIGQSVWTDGENVYYSRGNNQYVYNSNTDSWDTKTWTGLTYYNGSYVWTDGENIYYSEDTDHYVLDKSTSTWSTKTWYGLTGVDFFSGSQIWTNNGNIYYSLGGDQFVLDKTTSTWNEKTWYGLDDFSKGSIWTAGENYYYSSSDSQYVLDQETSTWIQTEWSGLTNPSASNIWTDGENIYHSSYNFSTMNVVNYQCIIPSKKILIGENGIYSSVDIEDIVPEVSNKIVDLVYPVGSIYMSVASTSPATLFGGTWEQLKDRFLLGAGDTHTAGDTGGAATISYTPAGTNSGGAVSNHTLTTDEIPAHSHTFTGSSATSAGISANHTHTGTSGNVSQGHTHTGPSHSHSVGTWDCPGYDSSKGKFKAVAQNSGWLSGTTQAAGTGATGGISANHTHTTTTGNQSQGHTHTLTAKGSNANTGGGGAHGHGFTQPTFTGTAATIDTMPPYLSVYMWKRTA